MTSGAGDDVLIGGLGADRFLFGSVTGDDMIDDLTITYDAQARSATIEFTSLIGSITLLGVRSDTLDASDFVFSDPGV